MSMRFLVPLLFSIQTVFVATAQTSGEDDLKILGEISEWTRAQGGFISEKMEIKHIEGSLSGLFAKEDIKKGEVITDISWDIMMKPHGDDRYDWCASVRFVEAAITKSPDLQNPYERYLAKKEILHPYFFSQTAKDLLRELANGSFPLQYLDFDHENFYLGNCGSDFNDNVSQAILLLQTRGEGPHGVDFVPIHDLLNHRNGHHTNVSPTYDEGGKRYRVVATRDILAGEQLQNSYNRCDWCSFYSNPDSELNFQVTPQIFELYGFVELFPQRWVLPEARLLFDLDIVEPERATYDGELRVDFIVPPSQYGVSYLWHKLQLLDEFSSTHRNRSDIAISELEAIFELHNAMKVAFNAALLHSRGKLTNKVWRFDQHSWFQEPESSI
eukprot:Nitzschia sp. Nitz4//scaffold96_size78090//1661//2876//NITZ4_005481-RA/size78090-augustus-gene-0.9-mRNA-1//-1//CDS//3329560534//8456//frame0